MVHLDHKGIVYCDEIGGHSQVCDFFGLLKTNAQCGNCPLTNFGGEFIYTKFDGALWENFGVSCLKKKEDVASVTSGSQTTMD